MFEYNIRKYLFGGLVMYKINNFVDNNDVKILEEMGPFQVIEYQRDLSVMPHEAIQAYFCNKMNVKKRMKKLHDLSEKCMC